VIAFMLFVAEDVRERMAALGFRRFEELIGRSDLLQPRTDIEHWKARRLDLSALLHRTEAAPEETHHTRSQEHHLEDVLDQRLIELATPALERGDPVRLKLRMRNVDRTVGGMLSGAVARRYGEHGLRTTPSGSTCTARQAVPSVPGWRRASPSACAARPTTTSARASRVAG